MPKNFLLEVETLKKKTLYLSAIVEETFQKTMKAFQERDEATAKAIIEADYEIDTLEVDLEEECLKVLALHQPVASDLRYITSIIKINSELERIGDLACNICKCLLRMAKLPRVDPVPEIELMAERSKIMFRQSLDALMRMDTVLAYKIFSDDEEVDKGKRIVYELVKERIKKNPDDLEAYLNILSVSRFLERIADHATNIAEDVVYMLEGEIVRHKVEGSTASKQHKYNQ